MVHGLAPVVDTDVQEFVTNLLEIAEIPVLTLLFNDLDLGAFHFFQLTRVILNSLLILDLVLLHIAAKILLALEQVLVLLLKGVLYTFKCDDDFLGDGVHLKR